MNILQTVSKANKNSAKRKIKNLGPLINLEEYVPNDWWRKIFNSNYLKTDGDVVCDDSITKTEIDLLISVLNLKRENKILDLCCGQGRHSIELSKQGFYNIEGLDRSHYLIQKARKISKAEKLLCKFREGDARKIPCKSNVFDFVLILGNSFGYFESLEDDEKVLQEVKRVLKPGGKLVIDIADGEYLKNNFQPRSWEWINKKLFVCRERSLSKKNDRLVSREVITNVEKGVIADQFYAERLYTKNELKILLEKNQFKDIEFPALLSPDSKRKQDLGMMEQRLIALAKVDKEDWNLIAQKCTLKQQKKTKRKTHIVVLLGDPSINDLIKPNMIFDEDDFFTIESMKKALSELKEYKFTYLHNHSTLYYDLMLMKDDIDLVLNLCDEGLYNDPLKELHVPALLECLKIPYTGSGPQCLAYCYDKSLIRGIARELNIQVPRAIVVNSEDQTFKIPFNFPVIIKPNMGDSSFGITQNSVVSKAEDLINAVSEVRKRFGYDKPVLVEEFLTGKDISVGIIGTPPSEYTVLPIIEEDYSSLPEKYPKICGYEAKWEPESPYSAIKSIPAELSEHVENKLINHCINLAERLNCCDYTRFDWRLDNKDIPKLLEVNPNPGWCWDGHLAKMAEHTDIDYPDMLKKIIDASIKRLESGNNK